MPEMALRPERLQCPGLPLLAPAFSCFFGDKVEQWRSRAGEGECPPGHGQQVHALIEGRAMPGSSPLPG